MSDTREYTIDQLEALVSDTHVFRAYLANLKEVETAESEADTLKRHDKKRKVLESATRHLAADATKAEVDLLFDLAAKAIRINIAHRTAAFSARWGISIKGLPDVREPS